MVILYGKTPAHQRIERNHFINTVSKPDTPLILSATLIAIVAFGITLFLSKLSLFSFLEFKGLDLLFTLRGALPAPKSIIIIAIDEPSMAEIKRQWPWPRDLHAHLIHQLQQAGAAVIGFDILFAEPSTPEQDQALARALRESDNGVLASALSAVDDPLFRHTMRIDPITILQEVAWVGGATVNIDPDGIVRRAQLLTPDIPSFSLQIVRRYLERTKTTVPEHLLLNQHDLLREHLIDYLGPSKTIQTVSYYQALDLQHLLPPGIFNDKIVLIGRMLEAIPEPQRLSGDTFLTPFSWTSGHSIAGVEIQATLVDNLLHDRAIIELTPTQYWLGLLALALSASLLTMRLKPVAILSITTLLAILYLAIAWMAFVTIRLWLPILAGITILLLVQGGYLLLRVLTVERDRRRLLEEINRDLEAKITARTQELAAANQALSQRHQQLETAYAELTHTQQQLVQSEKMASLGLLVAGVAHELNNPNSYVLSNLELIEEYTEQLAGVLEIPAKENNSDHPDRPQDDDAYPTSSLSSILDTLRELTRSSKEGTERIKKIVLDLRFFSRTDDTGLIPTDLQAGIESTLSLLTKQYANRIHLHRDYRPLPLVECLPGQINQVFMNLLQNAAQAISGTGNVWIATQTKGDWVWISIRDDGEGIATENLPKIFDPFFTTKAVGMGTGLGLSISYGIVEKHGGKIQASSTLHQGSEFTVELPIRPIRRTI